MALEYKTIKRIYALLSLAHMHDQKTNLVLGFTNGRSESTKDMTDTEVNDMCRYLQSIVDKESSEKEAAANRMRKKILSLAHRMNWENADGTVNMTTINKWCVKHSYAKKELKEYTYEELPKLVSQVQATYAHMLKSVDKSV